MKLKKTLISIAALVLAGCAAFSPTATTQQVQTQYVQACIAYGTAFSAALQLREANKLSPSEIAQVSLADSQITPLCTGSLPPNPQAAMQQITGAVTALTILEAAKEAAK